MTNQLGTLNKVNRKTKTSSGDTKPWKPGWLSGTNTGRAKFGFPIGLIGWRNSAWKPRPKRQMKGATQSTWNKSWRLSKSQRPRPGWGLILGGLETGSTSPRTYWRNLRRSSKGLIQGSVGPLRCSRPFWILSPSPRGERPIAPSLFQDQETGGGEVGGSHGRVL